MREVRIGRRTLGRGQPAYLVAEAGSNHNGDLGQARSLIDAAAQAGADAVKFQTFRADALYPKTAGRTDYLGDPRSIHDIIRALEMPLEWIPALARHCASRGVDFLSTPFDEETADALEPYVAAFKIASYEMTHHGLIQHCARKGKPVILSTGTANLDEVREAVEAFRSVGGSDLIVLQCTAKYPAPLGTLNVLAMAAMGRDFGVPVGLSDHSREPTAGPVAAVALGAVVVEKHFTLSRRMPGPDHGYALEPDELAELVKHVRQVELALGSSEKRPASEEQELRAFARRSVFTTRAVACGEALSVGNIAVLRCGKLAPGAHPREFIRLLGRTARRDIAPDTAVTAPDVDKWRAGRGPVELRPLTLEDADRIISWRNDVAVAAQLFSDEPPTRESHLAWFENLGRRCDRLEFIVLLEKREVGTVGLSGIDLGRREAELGILIGEPSARGQGVAFEACRLLLTFGFETLGLRGIRLQLFSENEKARKLYERLGFTADATRQHRFKGGVERDVTNMWLTREAFSGGGEAQ